jgi:hypothetical protein
MGCGVVATAASNDVRISKIDAAVRAVLTEIGGGAEMTMLRSHRYCWGRTHVNPWVTNV